MIQAHESKSQLLKQKIYMDSIDYYREHPDVFTEDVLEIKLNLYQKVLMRAFFKYNYSCFCLGRGLGKSFLGILCLTVYCILFPNTKAGIISPAFRQGKTVIQEKFHDELCQMSPFLAQEVSNFVCSTQKAKVEFFNGSWIEAYPVGTDGSKIRGARLNVILVDEAAYTPKYIIENVVKPMAIVKSGYSVGGENNARNNKILLCSTPYYRFNHLYPMFLDYLTHMADPNNTKYFACIFSYKMGIHVGLFDESIVEQQKAVMSSVDFEMEYMGNFPKLAENAWIPFDDLQACSDLTHIETKGINQFEYIMSIDVARMEGKDNTIIYVFKLHWFSDHAEADLVYIKSMNGETFENQAIAVRNTLKRFPKVIQIYQDTMTIGQGLSDELAKDYYDVDDNKWYPPLIDQNDEQAMGRINQTKGVPIIYGIKASPEINHKMGYAVKTFTEKHWVHLYPYNVSEKEDLTQEQKRQVEESEAARMEITNIETMGVSGGWLKFGAKSGRKDRWSAMGMGLYGLTMLADDRLNKEDELLEPIISLR